MPYWMSRLPISVRDRVSLRRDPDLIGTVWEKQGTKCLVQWDSAAACEASNPDNWYDVDEIELVTF